MDKTPIKTPLGTLKWVNVTGQGRKNLNGKQEFSVDINMSEAEAKPIIDQIQALWDAGKPKGAKEPKSVGYKKLDDGSINFTFKTATTYTSGDPKTIRIYNAKAQEVVLPPSLKIGNGSKGRVSGLAAIYDAGVAARGVCLYLDALQITNLIEYKGADDFEADESGDFNGVGNEEAPFV